MPIVYRIDHERKVVLTRGYRAFTDEDVFTYQHTVWSRPDVAGYSELVDMTFVTDIPLPSIHRVRDLATTAASMDHPSAAARMAIVAPDDLAFGLGRMFESYKSFDERTTKEVSVFRTFPEAYAFLNITDSPQLPDIPREA
jgi:hypothetical protein